MGVEVPVDTAAELSRRDGGAGRRPRIGRAVARGAVAAVATAVLIAVPTRLIPNRLFNRMTPTRPQDYVFLAVTVVLIGAITATRALRAAEGDPGRRVVSGGVATFIAVGCPVCNKVVVALIGTAGAMNVFAPLQPLIGLASIALLGGVLVREARGPSACTVARAG